MAGDMKDYLSVAIADYSTTQLSVAPKNIMIEEGEFRQSVVEFDDVSVGVITKSTVPIYYLHLQWPFLTESDAETIFDIYFDTAKAKGKARTIEFPHPLDTYTYIVRFWTNLSRQIRYWRSITDIILKVEGYKSV